MRPGAIFLPEEDKEVSRSGVSGPPGSFPETPPRRPAGGGGRVTPTPARPIAPDESAATIKSFRFFGTSGGWGWGGGSPGAKSDAASSRRNTAKCFCDAVDGTNYIKT